MCVCVVCSLHASFCYLADNMTRRNFPMLLCCALAVGCGVARKAYVGHPRRYGHASHWVDNSILKGYKLLNHTSSWYLDSISMKSDCSIDHVLAKIQ